VRHVDKRLAVGVVAVLAAGLFVARRCTRDNDGTTGTEGPDEAPIIPWCAPGLEAIAGGGCYAAPSEASPHAPLPLVLYLHGLFEKGQAEDEERERQGRVARLANLRGYAVLALRGKIGACRTASEPTSLVCWPSNERTANRAEAYVESWQPALDEAANRHPLERKMVLGFSNGGYFAGLVAERALFDADAFVVAHAGPVEPVKAMGAKPPLLLMSADEEASQEEMVRLDDELTKEDWPHVHYVRDGGHALPDSDIEVALTFFERTRTERLPLRPPLSSRIARARTAPRDGEVDDVPSAPASAVSASSPPVAPPGEKETTPPPSPLEEASEPN
jgi:predicted esterase